MITLEMKLQAKRVAKQIADLADEYSDLMANDEIYESALANLGQLPTGNELRALADTLMAIQNEQRCGACGKLLKGKGRGSVQVFCSAVCRVKAHKQAKETARLKAEALAEADRLTAKMLADNDGGAEADNQPTEQAKPINANLDKRSQAANEQADNGAGQLTSQESMADSSEQAKPISGAVRTCDFCHKEIEVTSRNPNKRFCSATCRAKASKAARAELEQK